MFTKLRNLETNFHLGQATIIIAILTLASRLLGFIRDLLMASRLGLSAESDVYFTAFRIPDLVYNLLILGTLSVAFIPVFSEHFLKDKLKAYKLASNVFNIALILMALLCLILFILAKPLTHLIAPGFTDEQVAQTARITQIMLLSPIIFTASNVVSSVLISFKKFLVVNTAPLLYNLGIIIGIIFFYPKFGLAGLAGGVIMGALMHVAIQIPELFRHGFRWSPTLNTKDPGFRQIGRLFLPRLFGMDISYVNFVIVSVIGSTLAVGSITAFNYANNIQAVSLGVFALSTAIAIFPLLSELHAKQQVKEFVNTVQHAVIRILYFIVPITILMLLFRAHLVRVLLGYGRCDWNCTITTFDTLGVLALGLLAQSLMPLFARAFYARQNTKTPVLMGLIAIIFNAVLSYYLSFGLGIQGIALGFVLATTLNCILLFGALHRSLANTPGITSEIMNQFDSVIVRRALKIILASISMGLISYVLLYLLVPFLDTHTVLGLFLQAAISGSVGILWYLGITGWLGLQEAEKLISPVIKALRFLGLSKIE
jgi:putative peptidoglycan lipid II flippase